MALELRNVTKSVGSEQHIHETSLRFETGQFNTLLGATNAGKSTLIRLMAGLDRPSSGDVWMDEEKVTGVSPQKRNIALVHQFFVNYPHMTVFENIASPLKVQRLAASEIEGRVEEAANVLQLGPMLKRYPQELSGGQQQRTALARAIVKESKAIFLDEPLANLDYKLREELREQLPDILSGRGTVVVYATSEPTEALLLGGTTALLHEGRVVQVGPTAATYRSPASMTAAKVFSDPPINLAPVTKVGQEMSLNDLRWRLSGRAAELPDGSYTMGIRPHFVTPSEPIRSSSVPFEGEVRITELSGSESIAHFDLGDLTWVSQSPGVHPYRVGEAHDFHLIPEQCLYFDQSGALVAMGDHHGPH
ncbi:MAG: ABC transporter ATP-binding protein [Pseudomonadota bacterium]